MLSNLLERSYVERSKRFTMLLALAILATVSLQSAESQNISRWIATDGGWGDPNNWDNTVPLGSFTAVLESQTGEVRLDFQSIDLNTLVLDSPTINLVLDNFIFAGFLDWQQGQISGDSEFRLFVDGQIIDATLETTFNNRAFVRLGSEGVFGRIDCTTSAVWNNLCGSVLEVVDGSQFGNFTNNGQGQLNIENSLLSLNGPSSSINWDVTNEGTIEINNSVVLFLKDYEQSLDAELILNNATADFFNTTTFRGKISGTGAVRNLDGSGVESELVPGGTAIGSIEFAGGLIMTEETECSFQIAPNLTSDTVTNIGGPLQLDGTLNIEALFGATTGIYTLFTYDNDFMLQTDGLEFGKVPAGFEGLLFHDPVEQAVKLDVRQLTPAVLLGDINGDGNIDLLDVAGFVNLLSSGEFQLEADINQDGLVNLLDVAMFVELLAGG